jgi:predicted RNA-binding Zn ribbon-like protein
MSRVTSLQRLPVLGGALCLDYVNTVDPRLREPREEFIGSYRDLVRWGEFIEVVEPSEATAALAAADEDEREARLVHARAIELREALYGLFSPEAPPAASWRATLEREWRHAMAHATIEPARSGFRLDWDDQPALDRILWPVARSAVELLSSPDLARVGECRGEGCGWLFLDTSKTHRRRWCSMAICGNREKARRHRQRRR